MPGDAEKRIEMILPLVLSLAPPGGAGSARDRRCCDGPAPALHCGWVLLSAIILQIAATTCGGYGS